MRLGIAFAALFAASPALAEDKAAAPASEPAAAVALLGPALNVANLDRALKFYVDGLGMKKLLQMGRPERRETMLGFGGNMGQPAIILMDDATGKSKPVYALGTAFDRLVLRVTGLPAVVARLRSLGFEVKDIRTVAMGYSMAFATDPEGYKLELVESAAKKAN